MKKEPLVSVILLSYNSEKTVTETLDSIYNQNYKNIELIVSDDASSDSTVDTVKAWLEGKNKRFSSVILNDRKENGGVPKNLNSAIKLSCGEYIKIIAGDDLLTEDCISKNVNICLENGYRNLITWLKKFTVDESGNKTFLEVEYNCPTNEMTAEEQYKALLLSNTVYGCLFFAEKSLLFELGLYNEDYSLLEDYPMWLKMTKNGVKLNFSKEITVLYRVSASSLSNFVGEQVVNPRYIVCYSKFLKKEVIPVLFKEGRIIPALKITRAVCYYRLFLILGNSRKKRSVRIAEYFFLRKYLKKSTD